MILMDTAKMPYVPVNFSDSAIDPRYANKRVENYWEMAEWIRRGGSLPPQLTEIVPELTQTHYTYTKAGKFILEPKEVIRERPLTLWKRICVKNMLTGCLKYMH